MPSFKDLTGQRFGRLTVTEISKKVLSGKQFRYYWNCMCDCGNNIEVRTDCLTQGLVKSCGCLKKEQDRINLTKHHRHKLSHTKLWDTYYGMKSRCYDKNDLHYSYYGGRGIIIGDEWLNSFDAFAQWSVKNGFSDNLQIDRIDNNGNYEPSNCRWVTLKENCRNRSTNVMIPYNNGYVTLVEYAEILGIPYKTAYSKYRKFGIKRKDL